MKIKKRYIFLKADDLTVAQEKTPYPADRQTETQALFVSQDQLLC
jgi:hypothetical protein